MMSMRGAGWIGPSIRGQNYYKPRYNRTWAFDSTDFWEMLHLKNVYRSRYTGIHVVSSRKLESNSRCRFIRFECIAINLKSSHIFTRNAGVPFPSAHILICQSSTNLKKGQRDKISNPPNIRKFTSTSGYVLNSNSVLTQKLQLHDDQD